MKKLLKLILNLENKTRGKIEQRSLIQLAEKLLRSQQISGTIEIDLMIVDQRKIKSLNKQYLKKNKVTDVLSFPLQSRQELKQNEEKKPILLGEIVISYPQAKKQAREKKIKIEQEITILFEHGLNHLLGYHHK